MAPDLWIQNPKRCNTPSNGAVLDFHLFCDVEASISNFFLPEILYSLQGDSLFCGYENSPPDLMPAIITNPYSVLK